MTDLSQSGSASEAKQNTSEDWMDNLHSRSHPATTAPSAEEDENDTHAKRVATLKERLDSYNAQINETLRNAGGPTSTTTSGGGSNSSFSSPPHQQQQNQSLVVEPKSTTTTIIPPSLDPKQATPPKVKFGDGGGSDLPNSASVGRGSNGSSASPIHTLRSPPVLVGSSTRKVVTEEPPLYPPAFNTPGSGRKSGGGGGRVRQDREGGTSGSPKLTTVNITVGDASVQIVKRPTGNSSSPLHNRQDQQQGGAMSPEESVGKEAVRLDDDEEAVMEAPPNVARNLAEAEQKGDEVTADNSTIRVVEMSLDDDEKVAETETPQQQEQQHIEYEELSLEQLENARFTIDLLQETLTGIAEKQGEFNRSRGSSNQSFFEPITSASKQVVLLMNDYHETVKAWEEHPFLNDVSLHARDQQGREEFAKEVSAFYEEADSVKPHFEPIYEVQRKHKELERKISRQLDDLQHKQRKLQAERRKIAELQEKNHVISKALYHNEEETKRHWISFQAEESTIDKRKAALEKREQRVSQWLRILEDRDEGLGEKEASLRQKLSEANRRESALLAEKENMNRRTAASRPGGAPYHEDPHNHPAGRRPNAKFAWSPEANKPQQKKLRDEEHQQSIIRDDEDVEDEDDSPRIDLASILQYQYKSSSGGGEPQAGETNHRNFQFSFQGDSTTDEDTYDEATTTGEDETPNDSEIDEEPLDDEAAQRFGNVYVSSGTGGHYHHRSQQEQPEFEHVTLRSSAPGLRRPHVEDIEPDD